MLTFFTDPYKDELLYSAIARYHNYIGNIDLKDTLEEMFDTRSLIATIGIQCNLNKFVKNVGGSYTPKKIISNNSIFPFYSPFLYKDSRDDIIYSIVNCNGIGIYNKIGIAAGGLCRKNNIYYCPLCAKEDIESVGEPYIHREHQLEGVFLCPHHGVELKPYINDKTNISRLEFICMHEEKIDYSRVNLIDRRYYDKLLILSKAAYYLLNNDLSNIDKEIITSKYKNILTEKGLATVNGCIKQNELYTKFIDFYGKDFLRFLESDVDNNYEYNWLRVITRNSKRVVHPIRHLLFIYFLTGDISGFFDEFNNEYFPFGKGPWPCLNKASEHYKEKVVTDLKITADYKSRVPVGTFTCNCGFIYSRKGPDKSSEDKYKIGTIKQYGHTWEEKLKLYIDKGYTMKAISDILGCDRGTIYKYRDRLLLKSEYVKPSYTVNELDMKRCKEVVLSNMKKYKNRTDFRKHFQKEYIYLYRHDKEWLFDTLPSQQRANNPIKKVDWSQRDDELLKKIQKKYSDMMSYDIPVRVTLYSLKNELSIKDVYILNMNNMPKSKEFIDSISESIEEFRIRRCKKLIDDILKDSSEIKLWQVQRLGGIRSKDFARIKDELLKYVEDKLNE